jgi:hypothetical protein
MKRPAIGCWEAEMARERRAIDMRLVRGMSQAVKSTGR